MNKIDEMIRELCPEGVKRVKLGEVCEFNRGVTITKDSAIEGDVPVIAGGKTPAYYHNVANRFGVTIAVAGSGAYAGYVSIWKVPIFLSDAFSVDPKEELLHEYLYLCLQSKQERIFALQKGAGVPHVHGKDLAKFEIPLPPLAIQQEIVSIMDSFSSLQSKLEEELAVRQKQMEFYREKLLTFDKDDNSVKWMKLGEVADYSTGLTYKPTDVCEQGVLVLRSSNIKDNALCFEDNVYVDIDIPSRAIVQTNDILICVRNGSKRLVGKCAFITEKANGMAFGAFMNILRAKNVDSKFLYYSWLSDYVVKQYKGNDEMPISQITNKDFSRMIIPVPSLSRQQEIVSTLDTMSSLIDKLKEEIELRKKQYEYYREALLSF